MINLFAPGKVTLAEQLQSLSVTKIGQPLAVSTELFVTPKRNPRRCRKKRSTPNTTPAPLVDDKKDES